MKYFKHFAHCGNKLKQHPLLPLLLPLPLPFPFSLPLQLLPAVVTVKHTTDSKTRPIIISVSIIVIHRGAALQQNMKIKIKHALHKNFT